MNKLEKLVSTNKNILTIQDLGVIWGVTDRKKLLENIKYYLRKGRLKQIQRGVYFPDQPSVFHQAEDS